MSGILHFLVIFWFWGKKYPKTINIPLVLLGILRGDHVSTEKCDFREIPAFSRKTLNLWENLEFP